MGRDSNPRDACASAGFQDRCLQPLGHPSSRSFQGQHFANCNRIATGCSYFSTPSMALTAASSAPAIRWP
jgi:hypothetical protein